MENIDEDAFKEVKPIERKIKKSSYKRKKPLKPETPEEKWKEDFNFIMYLIGVVVFSLLFVRFVAVRSVVDGSSMYPTLSDKDNMVVERVSYYFHTPRRFDVVVFKLKDDPKTHYVKRVIGLPGETIQIKDGYVYINGEKLEGDIYCDQLIFSAYTAENPIVLKEDEYFCMGDNRNNSKDSRSVAVGPVRRKQIIGRACFRFWPLNKIGKVK